MRLPSACELTGCSNFANTISASVPMVSAWTRLDVFGHLALPGLGLVKWETT